MQGGDGRRHVLWEVLADEIKAIKGNDAVYTNSAGRKVPVDAALEVAARDARTQETRRAFKKEAVERARRQRVYECARQLNLSALCLSGGGIRSASVSLGVIQALVDKGLLRQFNYLSTVSGGGYIGCWLSAWLKRAGPGKSSEVIDQLREKRSDPDNEPAPIRHLRDYSNYLTPKLGMFSADTWTAFAIVMRNILVNWLILMPALALLVILMKLMTLVLSTPSAPSPATERYVGLACLLAGGLALGYKLGRLYLPAASENQPTGAAKPKAVALAQPLFLILSLSPAMTGGLCFVWLAWHGSTPAIALQGYLPDSWDPATLAAMISFAAVVYAIALVVGGIYAWIFAPPGQARRFGIDGWDVLAWLGGVAVFATLIWLGASWIKGRHDAVAVIVGMPWFLLATMLAHTIYLLLRSQARKGDVQREWLGRASGWHFIAGLAWMLMSAIVLLGPWLYYHSDVLGVYAGRWLSALTAASGFVTALLGMSGLTSATGATSDWKGLASNIALGLAGPLFAVLMLILLSIVLDWPVAGHDQPCFPTNGPWGCVDWAWWRPLAGCVALLVVANYFANINAFSLHAVYRNRLIRCYLGGARDPHRHPDGFADFDWDDDLRVADLWDPPPAKDDWRPFHVINMTLNVAETNRLAWQQRKAMPFSVSPFYCGNADLGYRPTNRYGGPPEPGKRGQPERLTGISLGTAMAISGAAVSSNMGYHSSMSLSFLLTFFNVRLGVWLGNPGGKWKGKNAPYTLAGPRYAVVPLLSELFGLTSADSPYVYLSDGGHFEDLGLYEMVRRRCRWILVCDDDQDGKRGFEDLGNAVRKIWIDLGVRITFPDAPLLQAGMDAKPADIPYFALGTIEYVSDNNANLPPGKLLYIKPVVRGDEDAADVIAYHRANPDFPAQTTADQWFNESQLEAYRRLGYLMTYRMISAAAGRTTIRTLDQLFTRLANLDPTTMKPRPRARAAVAGDAGP